MLVTICDTLAVYGLPLGNPLKIHYGHNHQNNTHDNQCCGYVLLQCYIHGLSLIHVRFSVTQF